MTEATITGKLVRELRRIKGSVVVKHNDYTTAGIPDLSLIAHGHTLWIEVKYVRKGKTLFDELKPLQLVALRAIHRANGGRSLVIAFGDESSAAHDPTGIDLKKKTTRIFFGTAVGLKKDPTFVKRLCEELEELCRDL